jgi:site-specific recombinase XerD
MNINEFKVALEQTPKQISVNTITSYASALKRLERILNKPLEQVDFEDFKSIQSAIDKNIESINSKKLLYISLIRYFGFLSKKPSTYDEFYKVHTILKQNIDAIESKNELKETEVDNFIEWNTMIETFKEYVANKAIGKRVEQIFLLGTLLLLDAPTRLGNYRNMVYIQVNESNYIEKIRNLNSDYNYLVAIKTKSTIDYVYIFSKYKTSTKIGQIVVEVKNPLLKEIITALVFDHKENQIVLDFGTSYMTQLLRDITHKIYGKTFSVNLIRHSFATDFMKRQLSVAEKTDILKIFGNIFKPNQIDFYNRMTK